MLLPNIFCLPRCPRSFEQLVAHSVPTESESAQDPLLAHILVGEPAPTPDQVPADLRWNTPIKKAPASRPGQVHCHGGSSLTVASTWAEQRTARMRRTLQIKLPIK